MQTSQTGFTGTLPHRQLREIDCSLAVVGKPAAGAESRGKSIHWPAKKCFIVAAVAGNITTTVNKGKQAGSMSSLLLFVYALTIMKSERELFSYSPSTENSE